MRSKKWLSALLTGFIVLILAHAAAAETKMIGTVSGGSLKMRSEMSTSEENNIIGTFPSGTLVNIISSSGNWYHVEVGGQFGYMLAKYIKVSTEYEHLGWGRTEKENTVFNLFSAPDSTSKILYKFLSGAVFEITAHEDGWYRVRSGLDFGYIPDSDLVPTKGAGDAAASLVSGETLYSLTPSGINTGLHETGSQKSLSSSGSNLTCTVRYPVYTLGVIDAALSQYVHRTIDAVTRDHSAFHAGTEAALDISYSSVRLDEGYTTVTLAGRYEVAGVEPLFFVRAFTLDCINDRVLTPGDYLSDPERIIFQADAKYRRIFDQVTGGYEPPEDLEWLSHCSLGSDGITFDLLPGEALPLSAGPQRITLKYSQCSYYISLDLEAVENGKRKIDPSRPMIALTFDDGPSEETLRILDVLEEYGGRATFCVVGNRLEAFSNVLVYTAAQENEIACHTWSHKKLTELSASGMRSQITRVNELVYEMTGKEIGVLRCPYGSFNGTLRSVCADLGMVIASWKIDTEDWSTRSTSKTYKAILNRAGNGDIVLMHDVYEFTANAVIQAVPKLVENGYQLVTVSELLSFHKDGAEPGTVYMRLDPANILVN